MELILEGLVKAITLIFHVDAELFGIILLSLKVSCFALLIATLVGVPFGTAVALKRIPAKKLFISLMNTLMGLPSVVVGLFLYILLSRSGPLGFFNLLYSPGAMVIAQCILAFPIVASLTCSAIVSIDPIIRQTALTLGASPFQVTHAVIMEARYGILTGIIAAFGRVIAEVGAIMIVGGNIAGLTRAITTAIMLETDKGDFALALALGVILLVLSLLVNVLLHLIQRKGTVDTEQWTWA